ncbi:MAG: RHS repeat-associated core domain-containing protein [Crinalium sp.]
MLSDGVYNYEYDAEGNRTKRTKIADNTVDEYGWDYRNRLIAIVSKDAGGSVLRTVGYEYDVYDQRVRKTVDGVVENYFIDRNQIAFVTDGSGNQTFHYLYGLNVDSVMAQDTPSGMVWALADRLGSIDTITDENGVVVNKRTFDSFGQLLSETNPSVSFRYGYTGRELDLESGLAYYRARYYDPNVGRFISVDPMGFEAGDTNLYRYVSNNSTNATDPSGEFEHIIAGALIGGVVGGVLSIGRQFAKMADGGSFDVNEVGGAIVGGAIFGGLAAANPLIGLGLGGIGAGFGIKGGIEEIAAGQISTGVFDIATSAIGLFGGAGGSGHFPGLNNGSCLAFAGSSISAFGAVRGAGGGAAAESLFSHFFAMSNGDSGSGNNDREAVDGFKAGSGGKKNISDEDAQITLALAKELGIGNEMTTIAKAGGRNVTGLEKYVRLLEYVKRLKDDNEKDGYIYEIKEAARLVQEGKQVNVNSGNADILMTNEKIAMQAKNVSGKKTGKRLTEAAQQLNGDFGELPPDGYTKVINIRVSNPANKQFSLGYEGARQYVKTGLAEVNSVAKNQPTLLRDSVDIVEFSNGEGTHIFTKKKGDF